MIKEAIMTKDCKDCQDVLTTGSVRQKLVLLSEIIESQIYKYSAAIPINTQFQVYGMGGFYAKQHTTSNRYQEKTTII
jgi:hypothetical protein